MFQDTVKHTLEGARGLSRDDILSALGLSRRRSFPEAMLPAAGIFAAGVLVGTGLALLIAPKSGRDLRTQIRGRASELSHRMRRTAEEAARDVRSAMEEGKAEASAARTRFETP